MKTSRKAVPWMVRHGVTSTACLACRTEPKSIWKPAQPQDSSLEIPCHPPVEATGPINREALPFLDHRATWSMLGAPSELGHCTVGPEIQACAEPPNRGLQSPESFFEGRREKVLLSLWVPGVFQLESSLSASHLTPLFSFLCCSVYMCRFGLLIFY